jgi:hypothetical protein
MTQDDAEAAEEALLTAIELFRKEELRSNAAEAAPTLELLTAFLQNHLQQLPEHAFSLSKNLISNITGAETP